MKSDELLDAVRYAARLSDAHPDFTDARIYEELTQTLRTMFVRAVVESEEGYWRQPHYQQLTSGRAVYPMPPRAALQTVWRVEYRAAALASGCVNCALSVGNFASLSTSGDEDHANQEKMSGAPKRYTTHGDHVRLVPTPDTSDAQVRMWYPLRPPAIVAPQLATIDGVVTSADTSTKTVTVTGTVRGPSGGSGSAVGAGGGYRIDVVSTNGGHELHLVGALVASYAVNGGEITFTLTCPPQDMLRIQAGDVVRYADESEYPMLPQEHHQTLADATAAAVLLRMGAMARSESLMGKVQGDMERMKLVATPRTRGAANHRDGGAA